MIQTIEVFSEACRGSKTTLLSNKKQRIVAPDCKDSFICDRFRESWESIKEEFYISIVKHKEKLIQSIHRIFKETFEDSSLPVVFVQSGTSEFIYPHLVQQVVDYSQKVEPNLCQLVIRLRPTDFQSLSLAVRALVEQCISKDPLNNNKNNHYLSGSSDNSCIKMNLDSVGPPADFLLQWYQDICKETVSFNVIVLIEDIYTISDAILTKFIQYIGVLRNQRIKFCLVTLANADLALFKAKIESQGTVSISLYPLCDSSARDALIEVLENVFVLNVPPFELSSPVLSFLREKAVQENASGTEFLRVLKLICFDYFTSKAAVLKCNSKTLLNADHAWSSIIQDTHLSSILERHDIKTFNVFHEQMQRALNNRNISHGLLQWICKDVLAACKIYSQPLDLYESALNGTLSKEKNIENIKSSIFTNVSLSKLNEMLTKCWRNLEPYLEDTEWRKEVEELFSRIIYASTENVEDTTETNESSLESESSSNRNWNAAKRRKEMLKTLRKRPRKDMNGVGSEVMHLLQKLVRFIDETFTNPFGELFTYCSLTHFLQISGYNTFCRMQWLVKDIDSFDCSKYRSCIVLSMPKGKKRIWPSEWFEKSLQRYIEINNHEDNVLSSAQKDKLWVEFWKRMMELHYCGAIHLLQKSQLFIERTIFD